MKQAATLWLCCVLAITPANGAVAQEAQAAADGQVLGPVTSLPLPRYVSLKTGEGNVRRGPSLEHRIDWVFHHRDYPLRVTGEFEHWRRVEDMEGQGGWIYYSMLSGVRTLVVTDSKVALHRAPDEGSDVVIYATEGVIGKLGACMLDWCEMDAGSGEGWVRKSQVWGVDPAEIRD